ncbi:M20/M25/M40 family metallo-hydrolase [Chitinimonas arctica]|uniref:M20/M25/M40 family metallo-hydrolase n=1 Tax=Chitinimonas arctica TaxID=2594795 RepID=A0A516SGC0_9NEIS|nr:M28 family metallopeptidase [Chitinimonas arctica]QDQ27182.1 M20/M25/M40 family metallo-hydrolase [Chitinimonas arctica]
MQRRIIPLLLAGLCLGSQADPLNGSKKVWITVGDAAFTQLQKLAPKTVAKDSRAMTASAGIGRQAGLERVHLVQVDESQLHDLSHAVHHELNRCGGFAFHTSEAAGRKALLQQVVPAPLASRPSYTIDNQSVVNPLLPQLQDSQIASTIIDLSAFTNRYYTSAHGVNSSNWIKQRWTQLATGRPDVTVEQYSHSWAQKSVILTIKGTDNASEVVVIGGHQDSINGSDRSENARAPGADDDASGIASMTEAIRVMLNSGYKPRRTIKFMAYAAEEVGLRGSDDIARRFKADNVNVVGVVQLDMTNYKGSDADIYIYTDYTDSSQNNFLVSLINTYLPTLRVGYDRCGYACSDHASWSSQGFFASMPFESAMNDSNPRIHTTGDTYANSGSQALHALKFARMAVAFAVELGSDGPSIPPPGEKVENFTGSVTRNQKLNYGPFKVAAGGGFVAEMTGTGDADLYVRKGSAPTTSSYDCRPYKSGSNETCSLVVNPAGDVYVMVNGYTSGTSTYNLKVTYRAQP